MSEIRVTNWHAPIEVPVEALTAATPSLYAQMMTDIDRQLAETILGNSLAAIVVDRQQPTFGPSPADIYAESLGAHVASRTTQQRLLDRLSTAIAEQMRTKVLDGFVLHHFATRSIKRTIAKAKRHAYHGARKQRRAEARVRRALDRLTPLLSFQHAYTPEPYEPHLAGLLSTRTHGLLGVPMVVSHVV